MSLESCLWPERLLNSTKLLIFPTISFPQFVVNQLIYLLFEDLGGHVVGGVARGHQHAVVGPQLLGEPKVTDSYGVGVARIVRIENV